MSIWIFVFFALLPGKIESQSKNCLSAYFFRLEYKKSLYVIEIMMYFCSELISLFYGIELFILQVQKGIMR